MNGLFSPRGQARIATRRLLYGLLVLAFLEALVVPLAVSAQTMGYDSCRLHTNGATASYTISSADALAVCQAIVSASNRPYSRLFGQRWTAEQVSLPDGLAGEPVCWTTDSEGREWVVWELSVVAYRTVALSYCDALSGAGFAPLEWSAGAAGRGSGATSDAIVFAMRNGWTAPAFVTDQAVVEQSAQQYVATLQNICIQQLTAFVSDGLLHWERVPAYLRSAMERQCLPETIAQLEAR